VFSLMVVKRDRATDEKQVALLKIVLLGSPSEKEDPSSEVCKFRPEVDQSRYTLCQYFERKYLRELDVDGKLYDSALSDLIWDAVDSTSSVTFLSCISPCIDHFDTTIVDLRYACKSRKERPTTAARLERVKFRWQNQSAAWAFTLWKGAVADSVQIQLNHEIDNMTEEMEEMRGENSELKGKLQHMAYEGVEYMSDGDKEKSDDEIAEDTDVLAQQRQLLEKAIGKEMLKLKERQEGAVMQTVIAKMRYSEAKTNALSQNNKALARMLHHERHGSRSQAATERTRSPSRSSAHMPKVTRSRTTMGALGPGMERSLSSSASGGGLLPPLKVAALQAWGANDTTERASKKQALGRTR